MVNLNDNPPSSPSPMLRLPAEYDGALLGHTLDPLGPPRNVYSLTRMVSIHQRIHHIVSPIDGAESVWNFIQAIAKEHGGRMPVFVEDSEVENAPKLWTPGG